MWGIVVAAGTGSRFGGNKHVAELAGRPLWQWASDALISAGAAGVIIVGPVPGGVAGGPRRQDSVANGLAQVPDDVELIAVHDAARPLASADLVRGMRRALASSAADGVVPTMPVRDTMKEVDDAGRIVRTLDRSALVAVQTPQLFRAASLRAAHRDVVGDATDDASMIELTGGTVITVPGEASALKITYPEDMVVAQHYLERLT